MRAEPLVGAGQRCRRNRSAGGVGLVRGSISYRFGARWLSGPPTRDACFTRQRADVRAGEWHTAVNLAGLGASAQGVERAGDNDFVCAQSGSFGLFVAVAGFGEFLERVGGISHARHFSGSDLRKSLPQS